LWAFIKGLRIKRKDKALAIAELKMEIRCLKILNITSDKVSYVNYVVKNIAVSLFLREIGKNRSL
jgi:hypothetical protein